MIRQTQLFCESIREALVVQQRPMYNGLLMCAFPLPTSRSIFAQCWVCRREAHGQQNRPGSTAHRRVACSAACTTWHCQSSSTQSSPSPAANPVICRPGCGRLLRITRSAHTQFDPFMADQLNSSCWCMGKMHVTSWCKSSVSMQDV